MTTCKDFTPPAYIKNIRQFLRLTSMTPCPPASWLEDGWQGAGSPQATESAHLHTPLSLSAPPPLLLLEVLPLAPLLLRQLGGALRVVAVLRAPLHGLA